MRETAQVESRRVLLGVGKWTWTLGALSALLIVPTLIHNQLITGSLVNALLLSTAVIVGPAEAVILGLVPSLAAMSSGLLPLALAPVVPYIMVSNAIYIYTFSKIWRVNIGLAIVAGSLLKFGFLILSSRTILSGLLEPNISELVLTMMSYPQLITALSGGILTAVVIKWRQSHE